VVDTERKLARLTIDDRLDADAAVCALVVLDAACRQSIDDEISYFGRDGLWGSPIDLPTLHVDLY